MPDTLTEKESQLCNTIRQHFQARGGVYDEIKCLLQHRLVKMMRGNGNTGEDDDDADNNDDIAKGCHSRSNRINPKQQDTRTLLVNQLIMEYLHWHQFNYSAEMFSMETQMESCNPNRKLLEAALGKFQQKEIPILLEIVLNLWQKAQETFKAAGGVVE